MDQQKPGGSNSSSSSGPEILRPIPRRPFNINLSSPTPPDEDSSPSTPHISVSDLRFLDAHQNNSSNTPGSRDSTTPLSHTTSFLNLTAPPLSGIYHSRSTTGLSASGIDTPWEADDPTADGSDHAETTLGQRRPAGVDDETYELMRERLSQPRRMSSAYLETVTTTAAAAAAGPATPRASRSSVALALVLRAALLFALGVGYGVLVTRLPSHHHSYPRGQKLGLDGDGWSEWRYLTFWGGAGVVLGGLLPWFDRVWEETVAARGRKRDRNRNRNRVRNGRGVGGGPAAGNGNGSGNADAGTAVDGADKTTTTADAAPSVAVDWALVVRGIGAFVGIVFAIRKLPWASTMQLSLTLALANPFLWYLIDRSKPGFLLSAAVGLAGSAVLMRLGPDVMPAPAGLTSLLSSSLFANETGSGLDGAHAAHSSSASALGGLASQRTIETSIWMLSVLFCSCVCFGNIGRRLALNASAAGRGRWAGVR
ncbi:hypothetical protein VTK56DRAFT_8486 [Thermocarpiscus australiensis]